MSDEDEKGPITRIFEDWSRFIGILLLIALTYAQVFIGVVAHDVAWWSAGLLLAGENLVKLSDKITDKFKK